MPEGDLPREAVYVGLLFALFIVPAVLQRWRVPSAITSLSLGALAGPGMGLLTHDHTIGLFSTLGIVALFLFAGLDVELHDLRREARIVSEHLAVRVAALIVGTLVVARVLAVDTRVAMLIALGVLTPSTGFILDSLPTFGLSREMSFWVRAKAIATEIVALAALFLILQSASTLNLLASTAALVAMVVALPALFRGFARFIVPFAPKTEFAFLLLVSIICALITKQLGVYYLVGAFIVGMAAQRFRRQLPALGSEKMLHAIEAFASIFVPFYFFHAGLVLRREDFTWDALWFGLALVIIAVPARLALVSLHRKLRLGEGLKESMELGVAMTPTLVFTLVIAQILRERFEAPAYLFGGLVIYALINTVLPSFFFRAPLPEFESPEVLPLGEAAERELSAEEQRRRSRRDRSDHERDAGGAPSASDR